MRTIILILITCCTVTAAALSNIDCPTDLTGYYYHGAGGKIGYTIPRKDLSQSPRLNISAYRFTPSRQRYNLLTETGFRGINDYLYLSVSGAQRYSSLLLSGATVESGFSFRENNLYLKVSPSVLYRKTGNLAYGIRNDFNLIPTDGFHLTNRLSIHSRLNIDRSNRLALSLNSKPAIEFWWERRHKSYLGMLGLETGRLTRSGRGLNFFLRIGYSFGDDKVASQVNMNKNFHHHFSFNKFYGDYTPPLTFSPAMFPVKNSFTPQHGLATMKIMEEPPEPDIIITVRRGDYLNRISSSLPPEAEDTYRRNIAAIASYNNLSAPYVIHPGQKLRIPAKQPRYNKQVISLLTNEEYQRIRQAVIPGRTSDIMEIRLNAAVWNYWLGGHRQPGERTPSSPTVTVDDINSMLELLPTRADIENKYLLNIQSFAEMKSGNPQSALKKLKFALKIDDTCPVLTTNLALAYYLDNNQQKAYKYLMKGKDLARDKGMDTVFHQIFTKERLEISPDDEK